MRRDHKSGPLRLHLRQAEHARRAITPARGRAALVFAIALIAACAVVLVVLGPSSLLVRIALFVVAAVATVLVAGAWRSVGQSRGRTRAPCLIVDDLGVSITRGSSELQRLLPLRPTFGVSILASAARDKVVLAITSPGRLLCVGADVPASGAERRRVLDLLPLSVTVSADDLVMSTVLPDGTVLVLPETSWLQLLESLVAMDTMSLDRCFLSDNDGRQVVWTGDCLRTPRATFRLDQPFEWRAWAFQEADRGSGAAFQATAIRQGKDEVVFVSLLGADVRVSIHDAAQSRLAGADTFLLRDARLSDTPFGTPPPNDRRIAIDRLFMLPLRRALDRAHRVSRPSVPGASAP